MRVLLVTHFGGGGVGFEGDVGGFFEEVFAEFVEGFLTRGPVNLLVFLGFQPLSAEVIHEEAVFVGWADGRGDAGGEFQDIDGSAEGGSLGTAGEMALNDIERVSSHGAETIGVIEPEGLALAIELGLKEGVIEPPAGDGAAFEMNGISDLLVGLAEEKKLDGEPLFGGEWMLAGVNFVNSGGWRRGVSGCEI